MSVPSIISNRQAGSSLGALKGTPVSRAVKSLLTHMADGAPMAVEHSLERYVIHK